MSYAIKQQTHRRNIRKDSNTCTLDFANIYTASSGKEYIMIFTHGSDCDMDESENLLQLAKERLNWTFVFTCQRTVFMSYFTIIFNAAQTKYRIVL